ncbi:MAG: NADP-dependent oxidoreductase [Pseudomonadota bacterium]
MARSENENRRVILAKRPTGIPGPEHFALDTQAVTPPGPGQLVVRARYWSVDPAMRGWVNTAPNYSPPVPVGDVMRAFAVGEVVESNSPAHPAGAIVTGLFGWQSHATVDAAQVDRLVEERDLPISLALGVLGLNGVTAYFGMAEICAPKAGETVVVSTGAGAVGSLAGQIARQAGARAVAVAGGAEKCALAREVFGYDAAIDYREGDVAAALAAACPDGVDGYFDNTCGPISDAVMEQLAVGARIAICGTAAISDWTPWPQGPRVQRHLLVKRARMQGFLAFDYRERFGEAIAALAESARAGRLVYREHVLAGIEAAPGAIAMLYAGENRGKLLIEVD